MKLHELTKIEGSQKKSKRVGRGPGSGKGKTCGRGQNGQKSRSGGKVITGFEGGQMPLHRRLPKFGFTNIFKKEYTIINLATLEANPKIDGTETITRDLLKSKKMIANAKKPIKILGNGEITKKIKGVARTYIDYRNNRTALFETRQGELYKNVIESIRYRNTCDKFMTFPLYDEKEMINKIYDSVLNKSSLLDACIN